MLVEQYGYLGGNLTAGLVGPCMTSYSLDGEQQLIKGVFDEFVRRMAERGDALHPSQTRAGDEYSGFIVYGHDKVTPFEPEAAKTVGLQMCRESGVELLLHSFVADTLVEDGHVRGIVVANKNGLQALTARVTVDATGDGDVAARAGAEVRVGRHSDGRTQPMTLFFRVQGVDDDRVVEYIRTHPEDRRPYAGIVAAAREDGRFPSPRMGVGMYKTMRPGVWRINTTRVLGRDGTQVRDLTAAEIEGRDQAMALVDFFRAELPGFEASSLLDTAATVGVRESRRIMGDYELSIEDLQTGRHFDDVIGLCAYPVDIHDPNGAGGGITPSYSTANAYEMPYRSLLPRGLEDVLVAGRCVSATHEALGAIRVMPPAFAMGEAAGTAAALAVAGGTSPRLVPVPELQRRLREQGAYLGEESLALA
ncbi:FAD-dependent oxidoreductase [Pseudonocardia sp. DSM 110487]|uniref:FAD-dependent oxidoreductase n=1 Tax=Pseudonocardia sp. DSM 110487 TaxID=2865833 RepID=UPI001C698077|nr:FAD-dependent oxidoreductase [Pseudonocardia sp. DSM 110487]QYN32221.1 FAD-dependent oxidoreductase [Pseudonocardia sp. DSM 110487]